MAAGITAGKIALTILGVGAVGYVGSKYVSKEIADSMKGNIGSSMTIIREKLAEGVPDYSMSGVNIPASFEGGSQLVKDMYDRGVQTGKSNFIDGYNFGKEKSKEILEEGKNVGGEVLDKSKETYNNVRSRSSKFLGDLKDNTTSNLNNFSNDLNFRLKNNLPLWSIGNNNSSNNKKEVPNKSTPADRELSFFDFRKHGIFKSAYNAGANLRGKNIVNEVSKKLLPNFFK